MAHSSLFVRLPTASAYPASRFSPPSGDELDALRGAVAVVDERWEVVRWNRAMVELTRIARQEAIGGTFWSCALWAQTPAVERALRQVMRTRLPYDGPPLRGKGDTLSLVSARPLGDTMLLLEVEPAATAATAATADRDTRSAREARALAEIVRRMNQSLELDRIFQLIARYAAELLGGQVARLGLVDGDEFVIVADVGEPACTGARAPLDQAFAGRCVLDRRPMHTRDLRADPTPYAWSIANAPSGLHVNAVAAPLLINDRAIGAIFVARNEERDFDTRDEELLLALGDHAAVAIENARLFRAAARTTRHASILAASARSLALNVTPRAMYADVARIARTSLGADGVGIFLADPSMGEMERVYGEGTGADLRINPANFWEAPAGRALSSGIAEFCTDIDERAFGSIVDQLRGLGIASAAFIPLLVEGRPRGLLSLRFLKRQAFDVEQQLLLSDFGMHAAVAMRNALLFADLERRAARLTAIAQVQQAMSAAVSLDEVYAEIYRAVASVVDAPCFALLMFDPEMEVFFARYLVNDGAPVSCVGLPRFPLGDGSTSQAFRTGHPNIVARSRYGWTGATHELEGEGSVAVVLSAPIVHGDRVLGVLQAQSYDSDAYDWEDVDVITIVARQAGTAIANARAFEAERQEREQAKAAAEIARVALRAATVEAGAPSVLEVFDRLVSPAGAALAIVTPDGKLRVVAASGEHVRLLGADLPVPAEAGSHAALATSVSMALGADPHDLVLPLSSGDRALGVLCITLRDGVGATSRGMSAVAQLAAPVALALDTLLLREEERWQHERQRMLATAIETLQQPIVIFDRDANIRYANGATARQYGYLPEELLGMTAAALAADRVEASEAEAVHDALVRDGAWYGERAHRRRDGSSFPASIVMSPIIDADGRHVGQVASIRDLTEERRVAEQLRQSEKLAALGELVAGVAHEVNNPLTGISTFAQLLLEDQLTPEQLESVRLMKREADRAVSVIRDLLTFARKTGPRNVAIDMNALIEQTARLRAYGLRTAGVAVVMDFDPALQPVQGDDRQLQQVVLNLVVNAEHAMAGSTVRTLTLRTRGDANRVVIEVGDTGTGMSPDVQRRIFEPFFTTKAEGTGTGLGLSVSYGIVQAHGGTLTVQSAPGAGSTFRVTLPTAPHGVTLPAAVGTGIGATISDPSASTSSPVKTT